MTLQQVHFPQYKRVVFGTKYVLADYLTPRIALTAIKLANLNSKVLEPFSLSIADIVYENDNIRRYNYNLFKNQV